MRQSFVGEHEDVQVWYPETGDTIALRSKKDNSSSYMLYIGEDGILQFHSMDQWFDDLEIEDIKKREREFLLDFRVQYGWVVRPDGVFRDPDKQWSIDTEWWRCWKKVGRSDLAIQWLAFQDARGGKFFVGKLPVGGVTEQQMRTAGKIEGEVEAARGLLSNLLSNFKS